MNNKGFTLVEVLAVIVIIAVVGGIAVPSVLSMIKSSRDSSYEVMVDSISVAAADMYNEIDYFGDIDGAGNLFIDKIKKYNICSDVNDCKSNEFVKIDSSGEMKVNLQTLIGNGFLIGSGNNKINDVDATNKNKKVIIDPRDKNDIGFCEISVKKYKNDNTGKVCHKINVITNDNMCPSYDDFGGDMQCQGMN